MVLPACFRAYRLARGSPSVRQPDAAHERRRARSRAHVLSILARSPCTDCGEADVVVLEFDHLKEKQAHVANLVARGVDAARLDAEIARCEVVCVNCHRHRTAKRADWLRARVSWRADLSCCEPWLHRNLLFLYEHLLGSGCVDCGSRDLVVLDFDHNGPKRFMVTRGAWNGASLARLRERDRLLRGALRQLPST